MALKGTIKQDTSMLDVCFAFLLMPHQTGSVPSGSLPRNPHEDHLLLDHGLIISGLHILDMAKPIAMTIRV